ncbi:MAG: DUF4276 family protein [Deltaproteobacteria bacterium]|nr:DUF4276 family protein [Deltaproteobacteria bacterium]
MKVLIYVEGPSDRYGLEALLEPVLSEGQRHGVGIRLLPLKDKASILNDSARKAADHLAEHPEDWVFALPDLYPMSVYDGTPNAHRSFPALEQLLRARFAARAQKVGVPAAAHSRFRVHCLKHDLEVLLLAAPDQLRERLRTGDALRGRWRNPVEDQNDQQPPKRIVEALFDQYRKKPSYVDTVDAPWILKRASLEISTTACPQRFAPFVSELRRLAGGGTLP